MSITTAPEPASHIANLEKWTLTLCAEDRSPRAFDLHFKCRLCNSELLLTLNQCRYSSVSDHPLYSHQLLACTGLQRTLSSCCVALSPISKLVPAADQVQRILLFEVFPPEVNSM